MQAAGILLGVTIALNTPLDKPLKQDFGLTTRTLADIPIHWMIPALRTRPPA